MDFLDELPSEVVPSERKQEVIGVSTHSAAVAIKKRDALIFKQYNI